jgi:choline monooxygenase
LPELRNPGDFVASAIGTTPVVVVRAHDGEVRAFLTPAGTAAPPSRKAAATAARCYAVRTTHGATARMGGLMSVPQRDEFNCDLSTMGLIPVRVATLGPMVFGCLDVAAPPFEAWAGELTQAMRRARGADMELAFEYSYDIDVNWKVYVENGLEGYHVAIVHDVLNDFVETKNARHHFEEHSSYTHAFIRPEYREMIPSTPHLSEEEHGYVRFGHIFPNLIRCWRRRSFPISASTRSGRSGSA